MATITVSAKDRQDAEDFLETYLKDRIDGDVSRGTFLRDVVITAVAHTVALLRAESKLVRQAGTIRGVQGMAAGSDRDEAADDLLSNWFLSRKTGRPSRGVINIYLSADVELFIPKSTRFFYNSNTVFVPDYATDQVIPVSSVVKVSDAQAVVAARYVSLNVVSVDVGERFDVAPATWLSSDRFSPFVTRIENTSPFVGGAETESTDAFLQRAKDAVSVRDLNSVRSIRSTLLERFSGLDDVVVIGAGDPEMRRDIVSGVGLSSEVHTGGYTDVYLRSPMLTNQVYEAPTGGTFSDPRPVVTVLRSDVADYISAGVTPGMVIRVYNALAGEPTYFVITEVQEHYVSVSSRTPFPATRSNVSFSIGSTAPGYNNVITQRSTGEYARALQVDGRIILPQVPICNIRRVSYVPPAGTNRVVLTRANDLSVTGTYRVQYLDSATAHSANQVAALDVRTADIADGTTLRVEYDTVSEFSSVHSYIVDPFNRVATANVLARGMHPVYVSLNLYYTLRKTATADIDRTEAVAALARHINSYTATDVLNVSDVISYLQSNYPSIGSILPFTISYTLFAPDGRVISYETDDAVEVSPDYETVQPRLLPNPAAFGITSRTTAVQVLPENISLTLVS